VQLQIAAATWQIETRSDCRFLPNYFGFCFDLDKYWS